MPAVAQEQARDTAAAGPERRAPMPGEAEALPQAEGIPSPGGAFLRSLVLPGWGHASIESYTRGGFYFTAQGLTLWMIVRTIRRLGAAEEIRDFREEIAEARLREGGLEDPLEIEDALAEDESVAAARSLVRSRDQQFEDWLALGIFLSFLGGADAFVSAHLRDFPEPVQLDVRPVGDRVEVGLRVTLPPIR